MDLNLYLGLPPLPRPPGRLGAAMDFPAPADSPVPEAPRPGDEPAAGSPAPEEMPPLPVVYSPSNALSTPEMPLIDPMLVDWLDGLSTDSEDTLDAGEPAEAFGAPSHDGLSTYSEDTLDAGEPAVAFDAPSHDAGVPPPPGLVIPVPEAPTTDEPAGFPAQEEMSPLPVVDSPSNAPSTAEMWPMDFSMLFGGPDSLSTDNEEALGAGEPVVAFDAPSHDANTSPPSAAQLPLAGLEGVHLEWVERLSHPDQAAPAAGAEMVSTRQSIGGAIENTTPELRFQRLIQVSEQHRIAQPGPVSRSQRATSPEAERLAQAIQRSHSSLDASRRQNLDSDGKMGGTGAVKKNGNCGCNSSFECNICLDAAKEPVVTPCGHLFCWPCLYQWLHGHSVHSECPVCKGEVLEVNVTPIYGRGGGERDASSNDVPPRPSANRCESMRQQLQMPDSRGIASMVRRLIENQDHLRGQAAPPVGGVEVDVFPQSGTRATRIVRRRQQIPSLASPSLAAPSPLARLVRRYAPDSGNRVQLQSSNSDNENQDHLRGQAAPPVGGVEVAVLPEDGRRVTRIVRRRQQRPILASPSLASPSPLTRLARRTAPDIFNQVQLQSYNSDNAAPADPQQSSSVEQASTSSTMAVIVGQAAQSRRSRPPSEPTTTRRTRRRQQH